MNIYLIYQEQNTDGDTFDSAIVRAKTADEARSMHPRDGMHLGGGIYPDWPNDESWCDNPKHVTVSKIGTAPTRSLPGVILSSYNADYSR